MKKISLLVAVCLLVAPLAVFADEALYKAKCVSCHGADGKKNAKADLTSKAIQDKSDADLVKFITTNAIHKTKANAAQAETLVKHVRTFKK